MSDVKHTPGPWRLFMTTDGRKLIGIGESTGEGIADHGFGTWRSGEEQLANARLIAAAPDLLEALKTCLSTYVDLANSGDAGFWDPEKEAHVQAARAAIAKAEAA